MISDMDYCDLRGNRLPILLLLLSKKRKEERKFEYSSVLTKLRQVIIVIIGS